MYDLKLTHLNILFGLRQDEAGTDLNCWPGTGGGERVIALDVNAHHDSKEKARDVGVGGVNISIWAGVGGSEHGLTIPEKYFFLIII